MFGGELCFGSLLFFSFFMVWGCGGKVFGLGIEIVYS